MRNDLRKIVDLVKENLIKNPIPLPDDDDDDDEEESQEVNVNQLEERDRPQ